VCRFAFSGTQRRARSLISKSAKISSIVRELDMASAGGRSDIQKTRASGTFLTEGYQGGAVKIR
jgi:hypothetical protein